MSKTTGVVACAAVCLSCIAASPEKQTTTGVTALTRPAAKALVEADRGFAVVEGDGAVIDDGPFAASMGITRELWTACDDRAGCALTRAGREHFKQAVILATVGWKKLVLLMAKPVFTEKLKR